MHHPHSLSAIRRFRIAAFLFFGNYLLAVVSAGLLGYSLLTHNRQWIVIGIGFLILCLILVIVQWIAASDTVCPLCRTPVLAPKSCMKHRRARTFMGSHRLRVSLAILFRNRFRCPYCNESSKIELRDTIHGSLNHARR